MAGHAAAAAAAAEEKEPFGFDKFPPFYTYYGGISSRDCDSAIDSGKQSHQKLGSSQFNLVRLQPNLTVRKRQISLWRDRVLKTCREKKRSFLDIALQSAALVQEVFGNPEIHRQLNLDGIRAVLNDLVSTDNGRWCDAAQTRFLVLWHTPAEWAQIIYDWATNTGKLGSVETVFSLHSGEDSQGAEFHGIPPEVIMLGLENLELAGFDKDYLGLQADLMYSLNDLGGSTVNSAAPSGIRGSINVLLNRADTGYVRKIVKFANTVTGSTILSTTGCYFLGYMDIYDTIPFVTALATMWVGLHVYLTTYVSRIVVDTGKAQMAIRAHNLSGRPGRPIVFPVHGMEKVEVGDKYIRFRTKKQFWTISRIFPFRVPRMHTISDSDRYDNLSKDLVTTSDLGQDYFQLNNSAVSTEVLNPGLPALASPDGRRSDGKRAKFLGAGVGVASSAQSQLGSGRGNTAANGKYHYE
ncbi:Vacuolar protein-sorting-associated protein 25 [Perkinsus olseni]|uniref:Vacuolar protein-sorting-associated protein 25 n=1 Tax=Perkinsus olseni TaxID=32597 RepID=A0A7J6LRZ1_PEROL|nr:Vacuolar protein-sorting-associated protein 25 [Perkinsus olseni]